MPHTQNEAALREGQTYSQSVGNRRGPQRQYPLQIHRPKGRTRKDHTSSRACTLDINSPAVKRLLRHNEGKHAYHQRNYAKSLRHRSCYQGHLYRLHMALLTHDLLRRPLPHRRHQHWKESWIFTSAYGARIVPYPKFSMEKEP